MSKKEFLEKFTEFLYYKNKYSDFSVLIHSYEIEKIVKENKLNEKIVKELPSKEKELIQDFSLYLDISSNKKQKENFIKHCNSGISSSDRFELKRRLEEIKSNPEIGVSWDDTINSLEKRIGKKIKITSRS